MATRAQSTMRETKIDRLFAMERRNTRHPFLIEKSERRFTLAKQKG